MTNPPVSPASSSIATSVSSRERLYIVAFWLLFALTTVANRLVSSDTRVGAASDMAVLLVALGEAALWSVVTMGMFAQTARLASALRTDARPGEQWRARWQVLVFSLVATALVGLAGHGLRMMLFPDFPRRGSAPPWFAFTNAAVLSGAIVAAGLARAYSLESRAREHRAALLETRLAEATLATLRNQLDPHFLFNTLNMVSSLVERDPKGVRRMIARLSALLRASLDTASEPQIPLRRELELLDAYLDIMQVRFGDRLTVARDIDENTLDTFVPTFVLQPLVENAIRHGIEPLRGGGRIEISAKRRGAELVLIVRDNGPGLVRRERVPGDGTGIGLSNTSSRLSQLFDGTDRLSLERVNEMTEATVRLPAVV
ncbi:MAG: histidine kinase [Gemmatimonadaceae bacterium]|nr:histidine kinase [Gemmatimonadaceae bacterium]